MKGVVVYVAILFALLFFPGARGAAQGIANDDLSSLTTDAYDIYLSNPDSALQLTHRALKAAIESGDAFYEAHCYFIYAKCYWVKANYRLSTEYGFKALRFFENSKHTRDWSDALVTLARTLAEIGNYEKSAELILQSLRLGRTENDLHILAQTYREYSFLKTEINELDSALYYADAGIDLFERQGDQRGLSILYSRKSRVFFLKNDFHNSREYGFRSLRMDSVIGNRRGLGISFYQVAQNEHAMKNTAGAERLLANSIRLSREIGNLTGLIRAHELMATLYRETGRFAAAANELMLVSQYKDSLYNSEKNGQIQEMQSLYELEVKENTIKMLAKENALKEQEVANQQLFLAFLLVCILLLILFLFFLTRLRAIQKKTNANLTAKNVAIEQQREEMQAQAKKLQQLNQVQTKLFSVISHDLRGPIANLQSILDLFSRNLMSAEEVVAISGKLKTNVNVTQRTLENLLSWSISQMEGIRTERRDVDMKPAIDEACRLMEEVASRKGVSIGTNVDDSIVVKADPDQLQLVLRNLIHNGIKFSRTGSELVVSASREHNECSITVKDHGIGMSQEEIDKIIGPPQHFTKVGTQQEKGTGLGLLLCREFIERNGGSLRIKSEPGVGTEVSFTLPLSINLSDNRVGTSVSISTGQDG